MGERLEVEDAVRVFDADAGLFTVNLTVASGQVHALVGLNGSGKTTLMHSILGMIRLTSGTVSIDHTPIAAMLHTRWRRVGYLVDQPAAYPDLTLRANLELAARLRGINTTQIPATVDAAISELDLHRYTCVLARRLSQGTRQRLGLAVALQHHPDLIVLDEPTNSLDPAGVILLRQTLLARAARGAGVLVSSHHLDEVARIAHHISVFNHGRVIGTLDPEGTDLERTFFRLVHADDERRTT